MARCGYCSGTGKVHGRRCSGSGYINPLVAGKGQCPDYKGEGKMKCTNCNGGGRK